MTQDEALCRFLRLLNEQDFHCPEICLDRDGDWSMDWMFYGEITGVNITKNATIIYATTCQVAEKCGKAEFDGSSIPAAVLTAIVAHHAVPRG